MNRAYPGDSPMQRVLIVACGVFLTLGVAQVTQENRAPLERESSDLAPGHGHLNRPIHEVPRGLGLQLIPVTASTSEKGVGIDPATVAAYKKLGAAYGAMAREYSSYFREGREAAAKGVPAFFFRSLPQGA